jgi:predicted metal-dependent hydrolase
MAKKDFALPSGLVVSVYKVRNARNLRLSVRSNGQIRVSIPSWTPYKSGLDFARSREEWLGKQVQDKRTKLLINNQPIGKAHHLEFVAVTNSQQPRARVLESTVRVTYPYSLKQSDDEVQAAAQKASIRALRLQAEALLPQRLAHLAKTHGYSYNQVSIKQLKSRWGSCDQDKNIVLSLFLMQLPWNLIDYVLIHELTHTKILKHGPVFWEAMADKLPNLKEIRKSMRSHSPILQGQDSVL